MSFIGFAVRLLYFLIVPFVVVITAAVIPMTGVLVNIVLLIAGFMLGELLRRFAGRHPRLGRLFGKQLRFEAYYRAHPPRLFLYYVFYPLMLPYWLTNRVARQEFGLYRGFTGAGVALLVVLGLVDYRLHWAPEIGFGDFFAAFLATLILQIFVLVAFLIPLCVSIVAYRLRGESRRVWKLLIAAALSAGLAYLVRVDLILVPVEVLNRVEHREKAAPARALAAHQAAVAAVWADLRAGRAEHDARGEIVGPAADHAREALAGFYRDDEAAAFTVHAWPKDQPQFALVQCPLGKQRGVVWYAAAADGAPLRAASEVPAELLGVRLDRESRRDRADVRP